MRRKIFKKMTAVVLTTAQTVDKVVLGLLS